MFSIHSSNACQLFNSTGGSAQFWEELPEHVPAGEQLVYQGHPGLLGRVPAAGEPGRQEAGRGPWACFGAVDSSQWADEQSECAGFGRRSAAAVRGQFEVTTGLLTAGLCFAMVHGRGPEK